MKNAEQAWQKHKADLTIAGRIALTNSPFVNERAHQGFIAGYNAALEQIKALEVDRDRLDWLAANDGAVNFHSKNAWQVFYREQWKEPPNYKLYKTPREAIDAARRGRDE